MDVNKIISLDICEDSKALEHPWRDRKVPFIHPLTHSCRPSLGLADGKGVPQRDTHKKGGAVHTIWIGNYQV